MARKIKAVAVQAVHDADGTLLANVGDEISEAAYDRLGSSVPPGTYRLVIVEDEPKAAKTTVGDQGSVADSVQVSKASKGGIR